MKRLALLLTLLLCACGGAGVGGGAGSTEGGDATTSPIFDDPGFNAPVMAPEDGGTETGDPGSEYPDSLAFNVLASVCNRLSACHPELSVTACRAGIMGSQNMDTEMGLPAETSTFRVIVEAEEAHHLLGHLAALGACVQFIDNLACDSNEVEEAYDSSAPEDFSTVGRMLSPSALSCAGIFLPDVGPGIDQGPTDTQ